MNATQNLFQAAAAIYEDRLPYTDDQIFGHGPSARCVELPWAAYQIRKKAPKKMLDIGISLADIDYLSFLLYLNTEKGITLEGTDIVKPERVCSRYPSDIWHKLEPVPVHIGDIRHSKIPENAFDLVSCISVIEHIGYDAAAPESNKASAFLRSRTKEKVNLDRPDETDHLVLDQIAKILAPGGSLLLTVPAGHGGPVLLKDSLGYYCAQYEYNTEGWERLISHPGLKLIESAFFRLGADNTWSPVPSIDVLGRMTETKEAYSSGCALGVFIKA